MTGSATSCSVLGAVLLVLTSSSERSSSEAAFFLRLAFACAFFDFGAVDVDSGMSSGIDPTSASESDESELASEDLLVEC